MQGDTKILYWFGPLVLRPVPKLHLGISLTNTLTSPGGIGLQLTRTTERDFLPQLPKRTSTQLLKNNI